MGVSSQTDHLIGTSAHAPPQRLRDAPRSGDKIEAGKDTTQALIDANQRITTREIIERLHLSNSTIQKPFERPRFNLKARHMGSSCSHEKKLGVLVLTFVI
ncbi:hypothetical protein TNCV_807411 [Trichonephila clavipes]|nr:hypothetical protein TNCV_807411 [Trichonephila clavipes]